MCFLSTNVSTNVFLIKKRFFDQKTYSRFTRVHHAPKTAKLFSSGGTHTISTTVVSASSVKGCFGATTPSWKNSSVGMTEMLVFQSLWWQSLMVYLKEETIKMKMYRCRFPYFFVMRTYILVQHVHLNSYWVA